MEIEINNTPATDDDYVQLKWEHPAKRHVVHCRIRVPTPSAQSTTVVITNPDGRLRFPNDGDTTTTVTVPADGSWASFDISGQTGSNAMNDAVIQAHCNTATGALLATKNVTVFWFDQAQIDVAIGGNYAITGGQFTTAPAHAVNYSAQARIRPAGVDCAAPQVAPLRIGIMQNMQSWPRRRSWTGPTIRWNPSVAPGTSVTVPTTLSMQRALPAPANDSAASVSPLYDQPGRLEMLDPQSLQRPMGCAGGAVATSFDTPALALPPSFIVDAVTAAGVHVGTVTYATFVNGTLGATFLTWAVVFDTGANDLNALRERGWSVNGDTSVAAAQHAAPDAADRAPTTNPITSGRNANDVGNDLANQSTGPVGASTTSFTHP